jgi:hypothetical protein
MNIKGKTIEETFAEEAVRELPEVKQMLVENTRIHTVLALSLADIYSSEAKRLKAKNPADPRVAGTKMKARVASEKANEIIEGLVSRKSSPPRPGPKQPPKKEDEIPNPAVSVKTKKSEPVKPKSKRAPTRKLS